jgi:hypothetical protein
MGEGWGLLVQGSTFQQQVIFMDLQFLLMQGLKPVSLGSSRFCSYCSTKTLPKPGPLPPPPPLCKSS